MRKVTRDAVSAFYKGEKFKRGNTRVAVHNGISHMYLHDNLIAAYDPENVDSVTITMAGWPTVTTRERLSGVLQQFGFAIGQREYRQRLVSPKYGVIGIDERQWYQVGMGGIVQ